MFPLLRRLLVASTTLATALTLTGCSSSGSRASTQPSPHQSTFAKGAFDDLPRYPGSTPVGAKRHPKGVTVQSFVVSSDVPQQVVSWFADHLTGWSVLQPPAPFGTEAYRAVWQRNDRRLLVSSGPAPTIEQQSVQQRPKTQYTLTLGDAGIAVTGPDAGEPVGASSASG